MQATASPIRIVVVQLLRLSSEEDVTSCILLVHFSVKYNVALYADYEHLVAIDKDDFMVRSKKKQTFTINP